MLPAVFICNQVMLTIGHLGVSPGKLTEQPHELVPLKLQHALPPQFIPLASYSTVFKQVAGPIVVSVESAH
jgi:hypothetical protein